MFFKILIEVKFRNSTWTGRRFAWKKILRGLSAKEIAEELDELDTDDAADIISELPQRKRRSNIELKKI
jgi:Mg/Co/Ni transporter MgtE